MWPFSVLDEALCGWALLCTIRQNKISGGWRRWVDSVTKPGKIQHENAVRRQYTIYNVNLLQGDSPQQQGEVAAAWSHPPPPRSRSQRLVRGFHSHYPPGQLGAKVSLRIHLQFPAHVATAVVNIKGRSCLFTALSTCYQGSQLGASSPSKATNESLGRTASISGLHGSFLEMKQIGNE